MGKHFAYKSILCLGMVLLSQGFAVAQGLQDISHEYFQYRIKSVEQFMDRFSRRDTPPNLDTADSRLPLQQILTCFDFDYAQQHQSEVLEFAQYVVDNSIAINYVDSGWYAVARCDVTIGKRRDSITLYLKVELGPKGGYRWAIVAAEGVSLQLQPPAATSAFNISPIDHELNFMQLGSMVNEHHANILGFSASGVQVDQTSVFFTLVAEGRLKINHVHDLAFHFDVGDYSFDIKCFERQSNNSGWLIYNLTRKL